MGDAEIRHVFLEQVAEFSETLDERERQIVEERLLADEPRTLAQLGEDFGVSRERVRQLEARLLGRLREHLAENLVDFDIYAPED